MFGEVERVAGEFRSALLDRADANRNEAGGQAATWMLSNNLDCRILRCGAGRTSMDENRPVASTLAPTD
jgi:hypothetical protein